MMKVGVSPISYEIQWILMILTDQIESRIVKIPYENHPKVRFLNLLKILRKHSKIHQNHFWEMLNTRDREGFHRKNLMVESLYGDNR